MGCFFAALVANRNSFLGRLAMSAFKKPQPQLNGFVDEIFGYRHTRDLHESTFIYDIIAINSTFLISYLLH